MSARATDAKICLWQIKHRRVQTAAVGLCRGVYVFVDRVQLCPSSGLCSGVGRQPQWVYVGVFMYSLAGWCILFPADYAPACADSHNGFMSGCLCTHCPGGSFVLPADYAPACADSRSGFMSGCLCIHWPGAAGSTVRNMSYNSRGDALTTVYGFLRGLLMYLQPEYNCISRETVSYTSRGTIPHIVTNYPRAYIQRRTEHFRGCLQTPVLNPPKADFSIRCACNQTRVCRRKGSGRRLPNESVPTEVF